MNKPKPMIMDAYDYFDVITWIEKKYNIDTSNILSTSTKGPIANRLKESVKNDSKRLSFHKWLIQNQFYGDMSEGMYQDLSVRPDGPNDESWSSQPKWVNVILELIDREFPDASGCLRVWVTFRNNE